MAPAQPMGAPLVSIAPSTDFGYGVLCGSGSKNRICLSKTMNGFVDSGFLFEGVREICFSSVRGV
jgi:hypothetical protein